MNVKERIAPLYRAFVLSLPLGDLLDRLYVMKKLDAYNEGWRAGWKAATAYKEKNDACTGD